MTPQPEQNRGGSRWIANLLGAGVLLIVLLIYGFRYIWTPLSPVLLGGDSRFLLRGQVAPGTMIEGRLTGNDFFHLYFGSRLLWKGGDPYNAEELFAEAGGSRLNPYVYLPFTGLVLWPVMRLDYLPDAFLAWFILNHIMIWAAALCSLAALGMPFNWRNVSFAALILAASAPWWRNLSAGQLNAPLALAHALVWLALSRRRDGLAGLIAAAAALFKLSPGILFLYFLWKRRWRAAAWMAGGGAALQALCFLRTGWRVHLAFFPLLRQMGYGRSTWAEVGNHFYCDPANQSFNSLFHHLFAAPPEGMNAIPLIPLGPGVANALTWLVSLTLLSLVLWLTRIPKPTQCATPPVHLVHQVHSVHPLPDSPRAPLEFSLFIFLSLFLPSLCWDHYFVQLLFPILVTFAALERRRSWALGGLFAVSLFAVGLPFGFNFADPRWTSGPGLLMMSWRLWGMLGLFATNVFLLAPQPQGAENHG